MAKKNQKEKETNSYTDIYRRPTKEEIFMSQVLYVLLYQDDAPNTQRRVYQVLKNFPQDIFKDSKIREISKILIEACDKYLHDHERLTEYVFSEVAKRTDASYFAFLFTVTDNPLPPLIFSLANEILQDWKKEKKEYLRQLFLTTQDLSYEDFETLAKEIYEIESRSPIPEDQEAYEEDKLLSLASKPEDFNLEFTYLYPDFIPQGTINLWVAPPAQGKSALALAIGLSLLESNKVDKVLYLDGDNPYTVLKKRHIDKIIEKYRGKLFYYILHSSKEFQKIANKLHFVKGKVLIIIDTLRAFVGAEDINKGEVAEKTMAFFRSLTRDGKKTVILLHHVNKPPLTQQEPELMFRVKGATEFLDRSDIAFFFSKKKQDEESIAIELTNIKPRIPVKNKMYFNIIMNQFLLQETDEILTVEEEKFVKTTISYIDEYAKMHMRLPNQYTIENALREHGFGRNEIRRLLEKFTGKFWIKIYDSLYNQIVFKLKNGKAGEVGKLANLEKSKVCENGDRQTSENSDFATVSKNTQVANLEKIKVRQFASSPPIFNDEDFPEDVKKVIETWDGG